MNSMPRECQGQHANIMYSENSFVSHHPVFDHLHLRMHSLFLTGAFSLCERSKIQHLGQKLQDKASSLFF